MEGTRGRWTSPTTIRTTTTTSRGTANRQRGDMPSYYVLCLIVSIVAFAYAVFESSFKSATAWGLFFLALAQLFYGR